MPRQSGLALRERRPVLGGTPGAAARRGAVGIAEHMARKGTLDCVNGPGAERVRHIGRRMPRAKKTAPLRPTRSRSGPLCATSGRE